MKNQDEQQLFPHYLSDQASVLGYLDREPVLEPPVFLAAGVRVIGDVRIGAGVSVWYNTVIRGDVNSIVIGALTNIQDGCVIHVTHDTHPTRIGRGVTLGHGAVVHGCTLGDYALVGIGARVLDGAVVEGGSLVAAGAVVPPGMRVPGGVLVAGVPARVVRPLREEEVADIRAGAGRYVEYARRSIHALT